MATQQTVICLMGPTATGKTQLAMALAEIFPLDIINVDAALVYKGMDIGTAKPGERDLSRVAHQLVNCRHPEQGYSVAHFINDAKQAIEQSLHHGRIPLLVGGTMLYFKVLHEGLSAMPPRDTRIRQRISTAAQRYGWRKLHQQLAKIDAVSAKRIHPHHNQRIMRALEVYLQSGKAMSKWQDQQHKTAVFNGDYQVIEIALQVHSRVLLHQRVARRFEQMLEQGFQKEVEKLLANYPNPQRIEAFKMIGYRQMIAYLQQQLSYEQMTEQAVAATRQLIKRQLTWLRQWATCYETVYIDKDINRDFTATIEISPKNDFLPLKSLVKQIETILKTKGVCRAQ